MLQAYSYIRFSSIGQKDGSSEERQQKNIEEYAKNHGLTLVGDHIVDRARSAYKGHHRTKGNLKVFETAVDAGLIPSGSHLLIEKLDRLTRQQPVTVAEPLVIKILMAGITIHTIMSGYVFKPKDIHDLGKMTVLRVELFGGNTYTKDLSRRIRQGKAKVFHQTLEATKRNHKEGVKAGVAVSSTSVPHWLKAVRGQTIETHPDRVASVQKIFRLATQGLGTKRIIKQLIADGDKPFGENGHWSKQYVLDTLRNRKVLGEWTPTLTNTETGEVETKETIYDYYPRIIDQTVFDKVQEMISARNRMDTESRKVSARTGGRIGAEVKNLFSHLIKCKGRAMSYHCKGDGKYQYLVTNYVKGEKADRLRYDRFENAFLYFLKHLDWKAIAGEGDTEELTAARLNLEEIATEIDRIRHQIAKWEEIVNNPEAPMDVVISMEKRINEKRPRLAELSEAKARINAEIESLRAKAGVLLGPEALLETIRGRNDLAVRARCRQEILKRVSRIDVRFGLDGVPTVAKVTFINGVIGGIRFKDKQTLIPFDAEGDFPLDEECDFSIAPDYHESEELSDCSFFMVVPYFD